MIPDLLPLDVELPDELGCDPLDLTEGDVVANAKREVRVICHAYLLGATASEFVWLSTLTGRRYRSTDREWSSWAGDQVWLLESHDGVVWRPRSPFADARIEEERR